MEIRSRVRDQSRGQGMRLLRVLHFFARYVNDFPCSSSQVAPSFLAPSLPQNNPTPSQARNRPFTLGMAAASRLLVIAKSNTLPKRPP